MYASNVGSRDIVRLLLDAGADPALGSDDVSALNVATNRENAEIAAALIEAGAPLDRSGTSLDGFDRTPVDQAVINEDEEILTLLLDGGANPDGDAPRSGSPLYSATEIGNLRIAQALIDGGADVDAGYQGFSPLAFAAANAGRAIAEALLNAGADVNQIDSQGTAPLHFAVSAADPSMVELLLSFGASPDQPDRQGTTPLELANQLGDEETIAAFG